MRKNSVHTGLCNWKVQGYLPSEIARSMVVNCIIGTWSPLTFGFLLWILASLSDGLFPQESAQQLKVYIPYPEVQEKGEFPFPNSSNPHFHLTRVICIACSYLSQSLWPEEMGYINRSGKIVSFPSLKAGTEVSPSAPDAFIKRRGDGCWAGNSKTTCISTAQTHHSVQNTSQIFTQSSSSEPGTDFKNVIIQYNFNIITQH